MEIKASEPSFWTNPKDAEKVVKEIQQIKSSISEFDILITKYDDMTVLAEFFLNKEISENEINESYNQLESLIENMEFKMMLSKKEDSMSAICLLYTSDAADE